MLERIRDMFRAGGGAESDSAEADPLQLAVASLLVEAARMDSEFDADERHTIAGHLARRFGIEPDAAERLLATAEAKAEATPELYGFARTVKDSFDHEERVELMQMLWEVAYADGELHHYESNLMRRLAGLIYVSDRESGEARKRALARLGIED